ncbi:AzlC family ABC transporter permease [Mesorhizobium sp. VNQ89]|uniref:AzlC family ABC transporter permease n=1 Tax=Mesorhizobium quangtriensis TaxID=3157709 RepID=UPI0032B77FB1
MSVEATPEGATQPTTASEFLAGAKLGFPVVVASAPFAFLFGALAAKNGFTVAEATLMSATIFGGASQMVGIDLFGQKIAPWLVVLSIFAVNFRHVLYSASIGRTLSHWPVLHQAIGYFFLTDPQFAEVERKAEKGLPVTFAWYAGMGVTIYVPWVIESGLGAYFGNLIPDPHAIGMDFLLPIYFFGLVMSFRSRANWLPVVIVSGIASIIAYKTVGSPWHVSIGAAAGIALATMLPIRNGQASRP